MELFSRFKLWRLRRKFAHSHGENWHSHPAYQIDHGHEIDAVCRRDECWLFPLHRVHPRSII